MQNETVFNTTKSSEYSGHFHRFSYLRTTDIIILIACFGFCAILTMLVIGQKKKNRGYMESIEVEESWRSTGSLPQLPVFLKWTGPEHEL
ncbi:hypothetical protein DPMN_105404 [Dreissena polymorpha]|uniref:Uncharacterized protein n=2 Tax=Dreissena polymorpha TaxID=45954 RepID=A0A9D4HGR6_DREPO|nr:hypothetical protein DPMN_105404 [Dreissena polymorpha]